MRSIFFDPRITITLYHDLCDAIEMVNSTFTFPLIFVIMYFFLCDLFAAYNHIYFIMRFIENIDLLLASDSLFLILNFILQCYLIYLSHSTSSKAEQTAVVVSKILCNCDCDKHQQKAFESFLSQNRYRNLKLRTTFFTIDWHLILAVSKKIGMIINHF